MVITINACTTLYLKTYHMICVKLATFTCFNLLLTAKPLPHSPSVTKHIRPQGTKFLAKLLSLQRRYHMICARLAVPPPFKPLLMTHSAPSTNAKFSSLQRSYQMICDKLLTQQKRAQFLFIWSRECENLASFVYKTPSQGISPSSPPRGRDYEAFTCWAYLLTTHSNLKGVS